MALSDVFKKPVLIFSFDPVEVTEEELANTMSGAEQEFSEAQILAKKSAVAKFLESDVFNKKIRVPIVIDEAEIPAQITGAGTQTRNNVDYDLDDPIITASNNSVSVRIQLKSSLASISPASDIFFAIADKIFERYTVSPRVSFFGSTVCIYNGYLIGIGRTTENNSDREILTLQFERSKNESPQDEIEEKEPVNETPTEKPPFEIDLPGAQAEGSPFFGGNAEGRLFTWYLLGKIEDLVSLDIPEIYSEDTILNQDYRILISNTAGFDGENQLLINVVYQGNSLPLGLNNHFPYYKPSFEDPSIGYAVDQVDGNLFLGVESVS